MAQSCIDLFVLQAINTMEKIYLKGGHKHATVSDLLAFGFSNTDEVGMFARTYSDPDCLEAQCHEARRSFSDIFAICKTYFPEATREEVAHTLLNMKYMACTFCGDINKLVFRAVGYKPFCDDSNLYDDEYDEKGVDGLCWYDIRGFKDTYNDFLSGKNVTLHTEL